MHPKITSHVSRREKRSAKILRAVMAVLAVLFFLAGILLSRSFLLPCFLMTGLYFYFDMNAKIDYEYVYDNGTLTVSIIKGRQRRAAEHTFNLVNMTQLAPHDDESVSAFRRGGGADVAAKYDYTSYDDAIPYYTMILFVDHSYIKVLLDLTDEMLDQMKHDYPAVVRG